MGQFKPMVKMTTTEPSVELKLKKGGAVEKMQMGGALAATPAAGPAMRGAPARGGMMPAASPGKPSLAARRRAMKAGPTGAAPAAPVGMAGRMMAKGGETKAMHSAEMKKFSKLQGEMKSHAGKPASKAHKGLKTGGVVKGKAGFATGGVVKGKGGYATGGVAKANGGGYKKGGEAKMAMGGMSTTSVPSQRRFTSADALRYLRATGDKAGADQILNAAVRKPANIPERFYDLFKDSGSGRQMIGTNTSPSPGPTGIGGNETPPAVKSSPGVEIPPLQTSKTEIPPPKTSKVEIPIDPTPKVKVPSVPSPGGMKKGGAAKKAYATGGLVDSGRPVAMPQGAKKPSSPVSINRLSGTFKKGGAVMMNKGGDVPPKGVEDQIQTARNERAYKAWEKGEAESAKKASEGMGSLLSAIPRKLKEVFSPSKAASAPGSVTKTEKSVTVTPKKRGGAVTC